MLRMTRRTVIAAAAVTCAMMLALTGCTLLNPGDDPASEALKARSVPPPASASWPKVTAAGSSSTTVTLHVPAGATHFMESFDCRNGSTDGENPFGVVLREDPGAQRQKPCVNGPITYLIFVKPNTVEHLDVTIPPGAHFALTGKYLG